jgi:hypothetical protein
MVINFNQLIQDELGAIVYPSPAWTDSPSPVTSVKETVILCGTGSSTVVLGATADQTEIDGCCH